MIESINNNIRILKSGDQLKKRLQVAINLAEDTGDTTYSLDELGVFRTLVTNLEPSVKYLLTAEELKYLGF